MQRMERKALDAREVCKQVCSGCSECKDVCIDATGASAKHKARSDVYSSTLHALHCMET